MKLLTDAQLQQLLKNGQETREKEGGFDHFPVVKLFTPDGACTWVLSEVDPSEPDLAFGLCDLGMGCPEMGYVLLSELASVRGRLGLPIERDLHFTAKKPLTAYADDARAAGCVVA